MRITCLLRPYAHESVFIIEDKKVVFRVLVAAVTCAFIILVGWPGHSFWIESPIALPGPCISDSTQQWLNGMRIQERDTQERKKPKLQATVVPLLPLYPQSPLLPVRAISPTVRGCGRIQ